MERVEFLNLLSKALPDASSKSDSPFIINVIQKAIRYGISYDLMVNLNYTDLLYLIVNKDIEMVQQLLDQQEKNRQNEAGICKRAATPEEIARMHGDA